MQQIAIERAIYFARCMQEHGMCSQHGRQFPRNFRITGKTETIPFVPAKSGFGKQVAEHDKVASRFEWTGTHNGEFFGIPATGRPVRVWGVVIDRLEDGRIKDTRIIMDTFGMMAQLGVLPSPPTP